MTDLWFKSTYNTSNCKGNPSSTVPFAWTISDVLLFWPLSPPRSMKDCLGFLFQLIWWYLGLMGSYLELDHVPFSKSSIQLVCTWVESRPPQITPPSEVGYRLPSGKSGRLQLVLVFKLNSSTFVPMLDNGYPPEIKTPVPASPTYT